ncbi:MAG: ABC transporter ATP-binding protein [Pseudomonadales bacterium]|nr:ABC transporter ATP-binding protein [Pseudomonadales bacterium]
MLELRALRLKPDAAPIDHLFPMGEISVVLGRNFSGKTRLARTIAGLDAAVSGDICLDGESITAQAPGARSVALVYQAFVNYPNWSVFQNLASPLLAQQRSQQPAQKRSAPLTDSQVRSRVEDIAARLELTPLLDRLPHTLSGGQQQRVAIGRALAKGARVLVMDEPLVNLDYKLREALQLDLRTLLHGSDLTVIYTTSDPRDAFALGDSVLLMADQGVLQAGRPLEVYERPVSPRAADLMSDPGINRLIADEVLQVVRPEHLQLKRGADDDVAFDVQVSGFETNGSETFLHCTPLGRDATADSNIDWVARLEGLRQFEPGVRQTLFAAKRSVHAFPLTSARDGGADSHRGVDRHG